ncbi:MAG: class I SAM-dependent methyltransferase [Nitrospinae bacterium]|nr:class I SAM-dependent methyltransferase [Nitrospinota bacterium]
MSGGSGARIDANRAFFAARGITPRGSGAALDLGCGSGFQTIPLAQSGFAVTAIDLSEKLLEELKTSGVGLNIKIVRDNLLNFSRHTTGLVELAVCMGDTLTHLSSVDEIKRLISDIHGRLEDGGRLVLTFRNFTGELPHGERLIPVRSDDSAIFSCFLEYEPDFVIVHDILYERGPAGWGLKKSFYEKLRLSPPNVVKIIEAEGYRNVTLEEERGLATIVAEK